MINLHNYIKATHIPIHKRKKGNQPKKNETSVPLEITTNAEMSVGDSVVDIFRPNLENNYTQLVNVLGSNERENEPENKGKIQLADVPKSNEREYEPENNGKINYPMAIVMGFIFMFSVAMVANGAIYYKDCPAEPMIPISFLVIGCLMLFSRILSSPEECRSVCNKKKTSKVNVLAWCRLTLNILIQLTILILIILLSYYVFSLNPDDDKESANYCENGFYRQTYYGLILADLVLGIAFIGVFIYFGVEIVENRKRNH